MFSPSSVRAAFAALPPILKLIVVFALVNGLMIAGIASTRLVVFRNTAIIKSVTVGVYWDANCSDSVDAYEGIDWGIIEPGQWQTEVIFVRNEGNSDCILNITDVDWYPLEAAGFINFTSDYGDELVGVGETIRVTLALHVQPQIQNITFFGFAIAIEATG